MSVSNGPGEVTSGLVFQYDMNNSAKSWRGAPTTNLYYAVNNYLNGNGNHWINSGGATYNDNDTSETPPYISYGSVLPTNLRITSCITTTVGNQQVGMGITSVSPSTTYTMSIWVKTTHSVWQASPYMRTYVNNNSIATFDYNGDTNFYNWPIGEWIRLTATGTTQSNENGIYLSSYIGDNVGHKILYYGFQVEQRSFATPLVAGTRSTTQALLDLTNNSTTTSGSLVYNSDGTFNLSSSNPSYVQVPLSTAFNKLTGTINVWIYPTSYNGGNGIFVNRTDATPNAGDWLWIGPYSGTFYFRLGDGSTCCSNDNSFPNYYSLVPLNTWTNLCCTWSSGGTSCVYINGNLYQSRSISTIPSTSPDTNGRFGLGHANADSYFNGKMPIAQIYNRQLSAAEVKQNFSALRGRYGI